MLYNNYCCLWVLCCSMYISFGFAQVGQIDSVAGEALIVIHVGFMFQKPKQAEL
eukprot:m.17631 g.17631  ORF g.17631 m.17631 type:complete len:54 (-) comp6068_c0_seq1:279-440(-)